MADGGTVDDRLARIHQLSRLEKPFESFYSALTTTIAISCAWCSSEWTNRNCRALVYLPSRPPSRSLSKIHRQCDVVFRRERLFENSQQIPFSNMTKLFFAIGIVISLCAVNQGDKRRLWWWNGNWINDCSSHSVISGRSSLLEVFLGYLEWRLLQGSL